MINFIFVVIPSVLELFYVIKSLIMHNFQLGPLIVFVLYLITVFKVCEYELEIFKNKKKLILFFIVFPAISLLILLKPFNPIEKLTANLDLTEWYNTTYVEKKTIGEIYLYNESPDEVINLVYSQMTEKPDGFIDKYVDSRWGIELSKRQIIKIKKDEVACIKIRPGKYKLSLETENVKTGEQYYVDLNESDINLDYSNYFAFDGDNFFRLYLWGSRDGELMNQLKSGSYTEYIAKPKGDKASNKRQKRIEKYE